MCCNLYMEELIFLLDRKDLHSISNLMLHQPQGKLHQHAQYDVAINYLQILGNHKGFLFQEIIPVGL